MDAVIVGFACFIIALNVFLSLKNSIPILGLIVGAMSVSIGLATFDTADLLFQPYFSLIVVLVGVVCVASAGVDLKSKRHGYRR